MWFGFLGQILGTGCVVWLPGSDFRSRLRGMAFWVTHWEKQTVWFGFLGQTLGTGCVVWLPGSDIRRSRLCGMTSWVLLFFLGQT